MNTILQPCPVPWMISPSMSGVTLCHGEADTVPNCTVVLGGGRIQETGIDNRRIEVSFDECWFARSAPKPDNKGIDAVGFEVMGDSPPPDRDYREWSRSEWKRTGVCPRSGFYVATVSSWLGSLPEWHQKGARHYVVSGRDGYVELVAKQYAWREWLWQASLREDAPKRGPVVAQGQSRP